MEKKQHTRFLAITSAYNFRDIGGYVGFGGKTVKWRTLLRSGDFHELSDADCQYLSEIPVKTVVDFRDDDEIEKTPDREISSVEHRYELKVHSGNLIPDFIALMQSDISDKEFFSRGEDLMRGLYLDLIEAHTDVYKNFFAVLQRGEVPILYHCTAGKDRTGTASALLLLALGVDKKTVFEDYLMTNKALLGKYSVEEYGKLVKFLQSVEPDYLETALNRIDELHGSLDNYLRDVLNVDVELLRKLYLE